MPYTHQQIFEELQEIGSQVERGFGQINKFLLILCDEPDRIGYSRFKELLDKMTPFIHEDFSLALIMLELIKFQKDLVTIQPALREYVREMCAPHEWPVMRC